MADEDDDDDDDDDADSHDNEKMTSLTTQRMITFE